MKNSSQFVVGLLLILAGILLTTPGFASTATRATKPWHVTEQVQEGTSLCDQGTWSFKISWKPITHENQPWPKYKVAGYKCTGSTYTCTTVRCAAQITGCSTRVGATWAGITADVGTAVSGMRVGGIYKPPSCK